MECFATYINLVLMRSPERVPDFLAYMSLIVHAARQYQQDPWRVYHTTFRQQAAANKDWKWAQIRTSLWTMALTNAVPKPHCSHCLSLDHTSVQCPENKVTDKKSQPEKEQIYPICNRFNRGECKSSSCKFRHQCEICEKNHPETECPSLKRY